MPLFIYKAKNRQGRKIEGIVDAVSVEAVSNLLTEKDLIIINIDKKKDFSKQLDAFSFIRRVKAKDLVIFFRQLAVMIEANLPLVRALRVLVKQTDNKYLKIVLSSIADEVDGGAKVSAAMSNYPDIFSDFQVNIIRSGETSGRLSEVMNYLADQQEKDYDLQSRVRGAMIYPIIIIIALVVFSFFVSVFVIPRMTAVLIESGLELPILTRALIFITDGLQAFWWQIGLVLLSIPIVLNLYIKTKKGRRYFDWLKLRAPLFGPIFKKIYLVRICRSLSTLLQGGVPVVRSLEIVKDVVGNKIYSDLLAKSISSVDEGNPLAESLSESEFVSPMVYQMINIGEESGKLEEVLERLSDFYTREVNNSVNNLSTLIEPIILLVLGIGVGLFVAAVIVPVWQLSSSI